MTVSGVCRKFVLILCLVLLIVNFVPFSYADSIQAYFEMPVPIYETVDNGNIHVFIAWVDYHNSSYYLVELDAIYPAGTHFYIQNATKQSMYRTDNQPVSGSITTYNLTTGELYTVSDANGVRLNDTVGSLNSPNYFKWVNNTINNGFFPVDSNFYVTQQGSSEYDVTWATPVINQVYVRSVLPEPVYDRYNRYLVLTGENESHLIWIQIHFAELQYLISSTTNTYDHYDLSQNGIYALTFRNTDTGYGLRLEIDPLFFLYLQNLGYDGAVSCNIYISDFNLITGEYISTQSASMFDMQPNIYYNIINDDIQFDAAGICCYGVNYNDLSTDNHLHRAAVIYSVDPQFDQWRNNIITWLQRIYDVLDQTAASEDVTIDQNTSAASELHQVIDNLQPTDENGSKVNTADVVSERFSDAQQYVSDLSVGAGEFNSVVDDFLFSNPFFYVPLIVALAAGLLITILGKNKSND